ncbi:MAG TPA: ATP-binding protein [Tepidisphaeraceae bacterium]|nr:ATP-binding protein [Tepidisphaeraceae bacterium]
MFKSIRWTLQIWHAGLLAAVLIGFGMASYYGISQLRYAEVDAELEQTVQILAAGVHFPPPFRGQGGRLQDFGRGRGRGDWDQNGPPFERRGRGPSTLEANRFPDREFDGLRNDWRGPGPSTRPGDWQPNVEIPATLAAKFSGEDESLYFVIWAPNGEVLRSSFSDKIPVPDPGERNSPQAWPPGPEPSTLRWRDDLREAYAYGPFESRMLVGRSTRAVRAELDHFAVLLVAIGAGVMAVGLAGGWVLSWRAVRPIRTITTVAQEISASNLSRRIDTADTKNELGSLANVLNDTFARLEAAFQQQVRFTADASHELRTPLAVIHSHAQLALSRDRSAEEYQKMFQTCLRASDRMKGLVDSLLLLARADAGRLSLTPAPVDLSDIAKDCVEMITPIAAKKNVTIETNLQSVELNADALRIAQVATNLLTNAIRYNREGGKVSISVGKVEKQAVLSISDTGVGIAPENQAHLFERFYRVDGARSREDGGSGLGLAICKTIVEAHGGTIECASKPGEGTTFTVQLPQS